MPPVVHAPRRVPIQLKDKLQAELREMESQDIIARVTRPTDWVNSLVIREKENGRLRLCLDPKDLNKAIKREHHPTPNLEQVTSKLAGAKLFSKLDARNGYWNVKLDEENVDYAWNPSHSKAFQKVKLLILTAATLAYYDRKKPVALHVNASSKGLGAALFQDNKSIAFASDALTPAETRYASIERELLAVVYGCEKFHSYLVCGYNRPSPLRAGT